VEVKSRDEVGQLARGFNNMVTRLKGYIDKAYVAQIKQKEAELTALKTQIRPHFLYNTLEVIRMCAVENEDDKVADMIHSLSAQLKYVIGYNNDMVTLGQEIGMIMHYFKIIHVRYDGKIELEVNVPDKLMKMKILKLTLQPIIENAVEHGIKPKAGNGRVMISGEINAGNLEISVFDDGIGMNEEVLGKLNSVISGEKMGEQSPEGWKRVGIKNVHGRLKMNFGEAYGIDIKSYEKIGTVVKIVMPVIDEVEDNAL
jgi:two-component system sensor histidine kinase YesM